MNDEDPARTLVFTLSEAKTIYRLASRASTDRENGQLGSIMSKLEKTLYEELSLDEMQKLVSGGCQGGANE